jgi:hypothetical protein
MSGDCLVLHPDTQKMLRWYRRQWSAALIVVASLLLIDFLRFRSLGFEAVLVGVVPAIVGGQYLALRWNATLFVDDMRFGERSPLRRKRSLARAEVEGVERLTIRRGNQAPRAQFLVLGPNGAVKMKVIDDVWSDSDLNRLWQRLGVTPTGSFDRVLSYREFKRAYGDR